MPRYRLEVHGIDQMVRTLQAMHADQHTTNELLAELNAHLGALFQKGSDMADTLDDVRSNLQELNVDVDTAVTGIADLRTQLEAALAGAGVDQAARDEINSTIDGIQAKIVAALNPAVPVDPGTVDPVDPGLLEG